MCELLQQVDKLLKTVPHYKVEGYYICKRIATDIQIVTTQSVLMYPVVYNGRKVPPPYLRPSLHLCMYKDTAVHFPDPTLICQRIYEILDLLLSYCTGYVHCALKLTVHQLKPSLLEFTRIVPEMVIIYNCQEILQDLLCSQYFFF